MTVRVKTPAYLGTIHSAARAVRRGKFSGGAKAEVLYRKILIDRDLAGKTPKGRSEKSRAAWRNDPRRDEKTFRFINAQLRSGQPVRLTGKQADLVSLAKRNLKEAAWAGVRIVPEVGLPHWDHASDLMKMIGWGMASKELAATPFTLRLSEVVIKAASENRKGFGRHIQDRISRHLRQRLPNADPTFWFAVEKGFREEAHLHGAIVIPFGHQQAVKDALVAAGGEWRSRVRQSDFGRAKNLIKWVGYSTKWLFGSKVHVGNENITGATQTVRRQARACYQAARMAAAVLYP